jgi:hypothetical protein
LVMPEIIISVRHIPKMLIVKCPQCCFTCVTCLITKSHFNANCITVDSNTYIMIRDIKQTLVYTSFNGSCNIIQFLWFFFRVA